MNETPEVVTDALRTIATQQPSTIKPERAALPRKSSAEIQAEIRAMEVQKQMAASDIVKTVRDGWRTSEFWVALVGGVAGALAVAKGWISEAALADLTQNLGAPYILGRSVYKLAPGILERLKK